jgi:hypothetical protein
MYRLCLVALLLPLGAGLLPAQAPPAPKLLLAFASTRERRDPPYPKIYFYEHDGVAKGSVVGHVDSITKGTNFTRGDMHPTLSSDGQLCAFSSQYGILDGGRVEVWDRVAKKLLELPSVQETNKIHQMGAALSGDGKLIAYSAWARPGSITRWGIYVYDVAAKKTLELPQLNRENFDQRMPAFARSAPLLAFASNIPGGTGATDVYLYDLEAKKVLPVPELNSKNLDLQPALSGDGRLIAFSSDRPGGAGGRDIYLYDRADKKLLPLPGLNSSAAEQSPSLSDDGRYLAFVSERLAGAGDRDVYIYDRATQQLLPTPALNSTTDDFDPSIVLSRRSRP